MRKVNFDELGEYIRFIRERKNITLKQLSKYVSMSFYSIAETEKGECFPYISRALSLFRYLGINLLIHKGELYATEEAIKPHYVLKTDKNPARCLAQSKMALASHSHDQKARTYILASENMYAKQKRKHIRINRLMRTTIETDLSFILSKGELKVVRMEK